METSQNRWFFTGMGLLFLLVAVVGFGPSFVFRLLGGDFEHPLHVYVHAFVMFGWLILFITQAALAGTGRLTFHRRLGVLSTALFAALLLSAITVSINSLLKPLPPPVERLIDNIFFLQICAFILAPLLFWMGFSERLKRPDHHKRYMLLLTFFLLEAAASRMTYLPGLGDDDTFLIAQYLYLDALLLPLFAFDVLRLGRLSQATVVGVGILLCYQIVALLVWDTEAWLSIADSIEAFLSQL